MLPSCYFDGQEDSGFLRWMQNHPNPTPKRHDRTKHWQSHMQRHFLLFQKQHILYWQHVFLNLDIQELNALAVPLWWEHRPSKLLLFQADYSRQREQQVKGQQLYGQLNRSMILTLLLEQSSIEFEIINSASDVWIVWRRRTNCSVW